GAGAGGRHYLVRPGKGLDRVSGQLAGVVVIAAVEVRLATASLRLGKRHVDAETAQQRHRGHADIGKQGVSQASDHQGSLHKSKIPSRKHERTKGTKKTY